MPKLQLDHKDLRDILNKDPIFLEEVKDAILKTAIQGHAV